MLGLAGCPTAKQPSKPPAPKPSVPPWVDNLDNLTRLDPDRPVWLDMENRCVIFLGEVCRADYPLEFLVTYRDRAYEAIITSEVKPSTVHAGLLALGAEPGKPVQFQPGFVPPSGTEVAIELRWKDADGKVQSAPAQNWIRNVATKKPLDVNWVFAGSSIWNDAAAGQQRYMADYGEFICLLNLSTAMLDLPIRSASALESRLFEANLDRLPPSGTPVTLLLKPKVEKSQKTKSPSEIIMGGVIPRIIIQEEEEEKLGTPQP